MHLALGYLCSYLKPGTVTACILVTVVFISNPHCNTTLHSWKANLKVNVFYKGILPLFDLANLDLDLENIKD